MFTMPRSQIKSILFSRSSAEVVTEGAQRKDFSSGLKLSFQLITQFLHLQNHLFFT